MSGPWLSMATFWWLVAGVLVAAELASGTFYLLMLAVGLVAAALAAHAGVGVVLQLVFAAAIGGASVGALWLSRRGRTREAPASSNRAVNLDIGNSVQVPRWNQDRTSEVSYRGAMWAVRHDDGGDVGAVASAAWDRPARDTRLEPGAYTIVALDGNVLVVRR